MKNITPTYWCPTKVYVIPAKDFCSISWQYGRLTCHPLGSQTGSPTLCFAPVLNKVIKMCEYPKHCAKSVHQLLHWENSRLGRWHTEWIITGLWMCDSGTSSLTCHNTAQRTVPLSWRLATAAQQCFSYLTCKLMPQPDWLTTFSKRTCNAFWGCRLNIGWHPNYLFLALDCPL